MSNLKDTARKIAPTIGIAERSTSIAIRDSALMMAQLIDGALEANVPVGVVNDIITHAVRGFSLQVDSQRKLAQMHDRVAALGRKMGVDVRAYGECVPEPTGTIHMFPQAV
jgi:hypothetical protein